MSGIEWGKVFIVGVAYTKRPCGTLPWAANVK